MVSENRDEALERLFLAMKSMEAGIALIKSDMATKSDIQGIKKKMKKMKGELQNANSRINNIENLSAYLPVRGNTPPEINRVPSGTALLEPRSTWRRELPFRK